MTDEHAGAQRKAAEKKRLADALRANLKRRKTAAERDAAQVPKPAATPSGGE